MRRSDRRTPGRWQHTTFRPTTHARGRGRRAGRAGFTIVELVVSVLVLTVGVLGLAATAGIVIRQMGGGAQQALAATVAQSRFERLRSLPCRTLSGGIATTRGITEVWSVSGGVRTRTIRDSISYRTRDGRRQQVYVSVLPCI